MKRYTRKDIYDEGYELDGWSCLGNYMPINDAYPDMIDKLGELEDIEEKLSCPLDVLFKAIKQGKIWWHEQWCKVFIVAIYEESTRTYIEVICKDYEYHRLVFIDDYKKSWWLKENKEE